MRIKIIKTKEHDLEMLLDIQKKSFNDLLSKYKDYKTNPAAENISQIQDRFEQLNSNYYFIYIDQKIVGMLRYVLDDKKKQVFISPICILPEYQKQGIAKYCMLEIENINNEYRIFKIATILQEKYLCRFYEKLGYKEVGDRVNIKEGMDIIYYEKVR